jgi:uncharacterized Zn finger protein
MPTHARIAPRTAAAARARTWWGKAWLRAVEEAAYGDDDLRRGRALARAGKVGGISVEPGGFLASVDDPSTTAGLHTVTGSVPVLDAAAAAALVEAVAAESGRVAALLAGDLPHGLVEHVEEVGVELLPYGGELVTRCTCEPWTDPCRHGIAVLQQLGWLLEGDPFVLVALRGLERDDLLARVHTASGAAGAAPADPLDLDLDVAAEAVRRAEALIAEAGQ